MEPDFYFDVAMSAVGYDAATAWDLAAQCVHLLVRQAEADVVADHAAA